jgi:hypothetical protein
MKDAARLVYTLNTMTKDDAEAFGINEEDRFEYIRMDKGKVNITPPSRKARWFRLIGVELGNANAVYVNGDEVQAVEQWVGKDAAGRLSLEQMYEILGTIEKGLPKGVRYSGNATAKTRAAWKVVTEAVPAIKEKAAREIIKTWIDKGVLESRIYRNPETRKEEDGLWRKSGWRETGGQAEAAQ